MAWIATIDPADADDALARLYAEVADPVDGRVDAIMRVHSLHPAGLAAHQAVYRASMTSSRGLRKVDRELIALVVSQLNGCHY